jgi:predicted DNA binding protein
MREFSFTISYPPDVDQYVDVFDEHGSLRSEAVVSSLDTDQLWRLEVVTGDPLALERLDPLLLDESLDRETVSQRECQATRCHSLLEEGERYRIVYSYLSDIEYCDSVPLISTRYLDGGVLYQAIREHRSVRWRVLMQNDDKVGLLYDTIGAQLADGLDFQFGYLEEADGWHSDTLLTQPLRHEQRETLSLAVERGYFETPREVTLDELAEELDTPRSTVSYRLRRATAELAKDFIEGRHDA